MDWKSCFKTVGIVVPLLALPACSTIVNGKNQSVKVRTGYVGGADCLLSGGSKYAVKARFTTPAQIQIPRSKKALKLYCKKDGYLDAVQQVDAYMEETAVGNLLLVGAGVDAYTGALYKYPDTIILEMVEASR
ncbi:MAG: hypothetical protein EX271_08735 [Acidimicrobiales bacterium]|nr:hypothetical protein [Hyphomonadaceae bacterium]RZV41094.1 MAG: hypothetical protein EX271_08735 [Acidimicrobiales bacterium]